MSVLKEETDTLLSYLTYSYKIISDVIIVENRIVVFIGTSGVGTNVVGSLASSKQQQQQENRALKYP